MDRKLPSQRQIVLQGFRKVVRAGANGHARAASNGGWVSLSHPRWVSLSHPRWVSLSHPRWVSLSHPRWVSLSFARWVSLSLSYLSTSRRLSFARWVSLSLCSTSGGCPYLPAPLLDQRWVSLSSGAYLSGAPRPAVGVPISLSGGCPYLSGARPSNSGLRNHSTGNRPVISSIAACDLGYWPLSSVSSIQPASASRISSSTAL